MPDKKSLAIAYAMKRKGKKMADGGPVDQNGPDLPGAQSAQDSMRKAFKFAEGGEAMHACPSCGYAEGGFVKEEKANDYVEHEGDVKRPNHMAHSEDDKDLNQRMVDMHSETDMAEEGLVDRIMDKKSADYSGEARYSEGGKVANQDEIEAGFMPNEFDDLHLRDDLESSYGDDDNAGDALGNKQEDADRSDLVDRIMLKSKKQRYPKGYPIR